MTTTGCCFGWLCWLLSSIVQVVPTHPFRTCLMLLFSSPSHTADYALDVLQAVLRLSSVVATAGCLGQAGASLRSHMAALLPDFPV